MRDIFTKGNSLMTILKDKAFVNGLMEKSMMELGNLIKWKESVNLLGMTKRNTKGKFTNLHNHFNVINNLIILFYKKKILLILHKLYIVKFIRQYKYN